MSHLKNLSECEASLMLLRVTLRPDLSEEEYRSLDAINQSYLKRVHTHGVAHAEADKHSKVQKSKALLIGSLYHCLTLEPDEVHKRYLRAPNVDRRTKYGKEVHAEFEQSSNGLEVIKGDDWDVAEAMSQSAFEIVKSRRDRPEVMYEIAFTGVAKVDYKWEGKEYSYPFNLKGKLDLLTTPWKSKKEQEIEILDLKSMASLSDSDVIASARGSCWGIQSAFYSDCIHKALGSMPKFTYVCSEKEAPNLSREFVVSPEMIERGRHNYLRSLVQIAEWSRNGKPKDYGYVGVTELNA